MQAFQTFTSRVIPLDINDVDTDMIIPAQYLTKVDRHGYGENLFQRLREQDPDFVFNDPQYKNAAVLLGRNNFGCGSSREHAVWALQQTGIKTIIAESYSDIFYNNSAKNGLLLIILPKNIITKLITTAQTEPLEATVNLEQQIITVNNQDFQFDYDPFRKSCLLKGQDDLDYLLEA
ncbi:MAG: 3-isopropylmalate dehydratase small subunit, partial [Gammaproteobacteria bacterium]|nr:3-isopropylmalate dehydratase small subunit [Gammaproteobacteria bacterium]